MDILYDSRYPGDYEKHYGLWRKSGWWADDLVVFGTGILAFAQAQCAKVNKDETNNTYVVRSFEEWYEEGPA